MYIQIAKTVILHILSKQCRGPLKHSKYSRNGGDNIGKKLNMPHCGANKQICQQKETRISQIYKGNP